MKFITFCMLLLPTFPLNLKAASLDAIYSEFTMEEFDNEKPNGILSFWKLDCDNHTKCSLHQLSILCDKKSKSLKPLLDFYSTELSTLNNLKISGTTKVIEFNYSQYFGPDKIYCRISMNSKSPITIENAECSGAGVWSKGTKYVRKIRLFKKGPVDIDDNCAGKIEFP